ncbi:hypothetical protein SADUNF_Sadunf03G0050400 [Salix dunnii]|uniref:Uncharacterized protein n=1 Tax=Salix dunnii TaxID=1413687 RepID=A0A835K747_9ROSI|nr:hypothetical protein SADUNF_Sadunf03G0050400 [Salix dunnii]
MATPVAPWRTTASPLFAKRTIPVRSASVFRSLSTDSQSQVANTGGNAPGDYGRVELDRRSSSDRSPSRRGDTTPSFLSDTCSYLSYDFKFPVE